MNLSDGEVRAAWIKGGGSPLRVARILGWSEANLYRRRRNMAARGIVLPTTSGNNNAGGANHHGPTGWQMADSNPYKPRIAASIRDGYIVAFSDCHFWPGDRTLAFEGLLVVLKELSPKIVVSNGDALDGASISRHDPLGWAKLPKVIDELDATKGFLDEVVRASRKAQHYFVVGNHDSRFDRRLATEVGEFEDVPGMHLSDHLKDWQFAYAVLVNETTEPSFFVHNIRGGMYAPRNNVIAAGCTVFTGHLHSQKTIPVTTLLQDHEGIDCGMIARRDGPQFSYISSRPVDWREGFAVQRYDADGYRYPAELCRVQHLRKSSRCIFRGQVIAERRA